MNGLLKSAARIFGGRQTWSGMQTIWYSPSSTSMRRNAFTARCQKRLGWFGLELHEDKLQLMAAGHVAAMRANQRRERLPTFNFLGVTCYWGRTRKGYWRLKFTSRKDRFAAKLKGLRDFLWKNLNANRRQTLNTVIRVVRGWINYHGISDNKRRVGQLIYQSRRIIYRWFNRKGGRHPMTWEKLDLILKMLGYPSRWRTQSMFKSR